MLALRPADGASDTRAVADDVESPGQSWVDDGLDDLHQHLREAHRPTADKKRSKGPDDAKAEVPAKSGRGRRVIFDMSGQRVWLVRANGSVRDTYLVSGSRSANLKPGRYKVFSRSRHATGYDQHSTMQYFVRFTHGKNAAIGFHDIPVDRRGNLVQAVDDLGTPQSAGCIRQRRPEAKRMWKFATTDTRVVVVA